MQEEVEQIKSELNRIANTTEFNGRKLLNGEAINLKFHIGANAAQNISFSINAAAATDLGNNSISSQNTTANVGTGSAIAAVGAPAANGVGIQVVSVSSSKGSDTANIAAGDTAETIAVKLNAISGATGVTATATNTTTLDNLSTDGTIGFTLGSGGDTADISASVTTTDLSNLADEINRWSGTTGVTAEAVGDTITLTQAEGKDIRIGDVLHSTATETINVSGADDAAAVTLGALPGTDSTTVSGSVSLDANGAFTASSSVAA
jgi:flagellin